MAVTAKSTGNFKFEPIPADQYIARCIGVFDIGEQWNEKFRKYTHKAIIQWEIPAVRTKYEKDDGEQVNNPRVVSQDYTLSINKKSNLYKMLVAWRGKEFTPEEQKGFDIETVLGVYCQLQIINNVVGDRTYSNVGSVTKVMKGITKPDPELTLLKFSFEDVNSVEDADAMLELVPEWIRNKAMDSKNYVSLKARKLEEDKAMAQAYSDEEQADAESYDDDDIPF